MTSSGETPLIPPTSITTQSPRLLLFPPSASTTTPQIAVRPPGTAPRPGTVLQLRPGVSATVAPGTSPSSVGLRLQSSVSHPLQQLRLGTTTTLAPGMPLQLRPSTLTPGVRSVQPFTQTLSLPSGQQVTIRAVNATDQPGLRIQV